MYNTAAYTGTRKVNHYIFNELINAKPEQLILKVYDFAITKCMKHDLVKTNDALQVLINALNFEDENAKEISTGLMRLYLYCQAQMRKRQYDNVYRILTELRATWIDALKNKDIKNGV